MTRCRMVLVTMCVVALACRRQPVDAQALLTARDLGLSHLQRGMLAEAETSFRKVMALAPNEPLGYANLGLTYLRGGRYADAERELRRARRLDPRSIEIGLIAAKLYALTDRQAEARATIETLPKDPRVLYALAELEGKSVEALRRVLAAAPTNLAVRLQLVDALLRASRADSSSRYLEDVRRVRPEPPREAQPHFAAALRALRAANLGDARASFDRFMHVMEVTAPYQAALADVDGIEGPLVGRPVIAFNPQSLIAIRVVAPPGGPEPHFSDVTAEAGLPAGGHPTALALGDHDGDGADNLLVATGPTLRWYDLYGGFVADVTARVTVPLSRGAVFATFADFDNDGWLDLFAIGGDGRGYLLRNDGGRQFRNVTTRAGVGDVGGARRGAFADLDHDGDLDLLLVGGPELRLYRNNLDGTFTDVTAAAGVSGNSDVAAFGDFDGDARIDVFAGALFHNTGFRRFQVTRQSGPTPNREAADAVAADFANDGALDLAVLDADGVTVWRNKGDGTFARVVTLRQPGGAAIATLDYDNDGWLDFVVAGAGGVRVFRNDRTGRFIDRSANLPAAVRTRAVTAIQVSDVDSDGDEDLLVAEADGAHLLRNDGGNANLGMQVQLTALRTGSGKNNNFGIGASIEVRAGELYQTRVVTQRLTHFGLGPHLKADVLRVRWTNGVPQTVYFPGTDADVLEMEQLKGSCAFVYAWDGNGYRFVTDVMWRSALGMPVGLGGGQGDAYAPAGASQEYLRIPGEALQVRRGRYVLQFTEELWETAYLDEVRLLAVDHPDSVEVFVDERFVPPGPVALRVVRAVHARPPRSAVDQDGRDVLADVREHDDRYADDFAPSRYQGQVEPHDLVLDLDERAGAPGSVLVLRGWIYPGDASINVAMSQQQLRTVPPSLDVRDSQGRWVTAIPDIGFPSGKDKTVVVDLAGKFPTRDHHVRIRTNMQIYWNQAFVAENADSMAVAARITPLAPTSADLHFRGFSRMYRRGGRGGPHWFAYDDVTRESPWRPIEGAFTRFGDVLPLLKRADDMYVIMAAGDETTVEFDTGPALAPGWERTFLLYTDGWIKDADLNTAHGGTVGPLPFHAIERYPYGAGEGYPGDSLRQRYLREYDTRVIKRR